jgi:hypothetical protein
MSLSLLSPEQCAFCVPVRDLPEGAISKDWLKTPKIGSIPQWQKIHWKILNKS